MELEEPSATGAKFEKLVAIMARLRAADGCPWDREQNFDSIKPYTLEETYEVLDAIDRKNWDDLAGELGDFMLQAVFYAQMAAEAGHFRIGDCLDAINQKLIRRHPHIFGDETQSTGEGVLKRWNEIKQAERAKKSAAPQGLLDGVPRSFPALVEAQQISSRAAGVGFDWENVDQIVDKVNEEVDEVNEVRASGDLKRIEDEIGDLLFATVNLARFLKVDPEQALRGTNAKFRRRFSHIEQSLLKDGRVLGQTPAPELELLWTEAKTLEKANPQ